MTESIEEDNDSKNYNSSQLRTNQIRTKKNSLPQDREQLYAENLQLRTRIKELIEINTKMKTQLSIAEKQKINLCNIAEEEVFHPKGVQRSSSGNHKKSGTNIIPHLQSNVQSLFNNSLQKEKQNISFKKFIREQNVQIEKLNTENQRLKKTMKYTRMTELMTENKELLDQTIRLKGIIGDKKENESRLYSEYVNEIEFIRKKLAQEKESEKKNGYELKKQLEVNSEIKDKLNDIESKKIECQKRLNREIKQLKSELNETKSKLYEQTTIVKGKQCDKEDCIKTLKERNEFKKRIQNYQREIKKLKDDNKRQSYLRENELKKIQQRSMSKTPEKHQKIFNNTIFKKQDPHSNVTSSQITEKNEQNTSRKKQQPSKKDNQLSNVSRVSKRKQEQKNENKKNEAIPSKVETNAVKPNDNSPQEKKISKGNVNQQNLINTQQLIDSNIISKSTTNNQLGTKTGDKGIKQQTIKTVEMIEIKGKLQEQFQKKLAQSDGEYQELNYDQFEDMEADKKKGENNDKDKELKVKVNEKNNQAEDKKKKSQKQKKSSQKLQQHYKQPIQDEQMLASEKGEKLKQHELIQDVDKAELKLIKETLVYKFIAQNYSYDNFCQDIKTSDMKEFTIAEIMNLLTAQPFLLSQHQIESVIIYLFETDEPTGKEMLSSKDFIKKMKKFIGKAKGIDQEQERQNIQILTNLIKKDEKGQRKFRKRFEQQTRTDGAITMQFFSKVMRQMKVKEHLLQTAIAQITYVSQDLNHLTYDFFLKRFTESEE